VAGAKIQDRHIGLELVRLFYSLLAVAGLGHYLPVGIIFKDCANTSSNDIMAICYEKANVWHMLPLGREPQRMTQTDDTRSSVLAEQTVRLDDDQVALKG